VRLVEFGWSHRPVFGFVQDPRHARNFPSSRGEIHFYSDAECTDLVRRVCAANMSDLTYQGTRLYYKTFCDNNVFEANAKRPFNRSEASYEFVCFVDGSGALGEGVDPLASSPHTTLQLVDALLDATEGSEWSGIAQGYEVTLLSKVLLALPYLNDAKAAISGCRTATRLAQSWSDHVMHVSVSENVSRAIEVIVDVFARLDRAHSWLRTVAVANWSGSAILPPQVQVCWCHAMPCHAVLPVWMIFLLVLSLLAIPGPDGVVAGFEADTATCWCIDHR
jgi:hypothetical protein